MTDNDRQDDSHQLTLVMGEVQEYLARLDLANDHGQERRIRWLLERRMQLRQELRDAAGLAVCGQHLDAWELAAELYQEEAETLELKLDRLDIKTETSSVKVKLARQPGRLQRSEPTGHPVAVADEPLPDIGLALEPEWFLAGSMEQGGKTAMPLRDMSLKARPLAIVAHDIVGPRPRFDGRHGVVR